MYYIRDMKTFAERMVLARTNKGLTQGELAKKSGVSQSSIGNIEAGLRLSSRKVASIASALGVSPIWLAEGRGLMTIIDGGTVSRGTTLAVEQSEIDPDYTLVSADSTDLETGRIEYWDVKGSCGGGFLNFEQMPKGNLIKEASFFRKYDLKPENAFAIYADGDSMADFICDGDLAIFDKSKTEPKSGEIYAIEHPDGLRIKTLRRLIDGTWILESRNPDKRKYPDEVIPPSSADLLKIRGLYLYRQG